MVTPLLPGALSLLIELLAECSLGLSTMESSLLLWWPIPGVLFVIICFIISCLISVVTPLLPPAALSVLILIELLEEFSLGLSTIESSLLLCWPITGILLPMSLPPAVLIGMLWPPPNVSMFIKNCFL